MSVLGWIAIVLLMAVAIFVAAVCVVAVAEEIERRKHR